MAKTISELRKPKKTALLVGIHLPKISDEETRASIAELNRLVDTLGYDVIGTLAQKRSGTGSATVLGEGKLRELARWTGGSGVVAPVVRVKKSKAAERFDNDSNETDGPDAEDDFTDEEIVEDEISAEGELARSERKADMVVFDCELTPSQLRNLESATAVEVLDRTGVIIEIFSRHARTRTARLQVEIARLTYLAPRIRETGGGGDREGGGIGGKGAGESSQELDRRRIRDRIKELRQELEALGKESGVRRTRRSSENSVALIGYTNAGKSSLMRALTGSEILIADQLFATLDTTVRPLHPESVPRVLISDTVGFIKKLPHDLVASFRSTLDEANDADLLLFVVDASDPAFRSQLEVTRNVIGEIGAHGKQSSLIFNKRDRLSDEARAELSREFPEAIFISTRNEADIAMLRELILRTFEGEMRDEDVFVPYTTQGAIGEIRKQMRVLEESYNSDGVILKVRTREETLTRLKKRFLL